MQEKKNLTPKTPTPREAFIDAVAKEHGITKAYAAELIDRAFRHLKAPQPAEAASDVPASEPLQDVYPENANFSE